MTGAIAQEWVRVRTVRSTWWLTGLALVLSFVVIWLAAVAFNIAIPVQTREGPTLLRGTQADYANALTLALFPIYLAMGLLGLLSFGHEYRYGTIRATLTSVPRRSTFALAKIVVTASWAIAVTLASVLLSWFVLLLARGRYEPGVGMMADRMWRIVAGMVVYVALFSLLGLALAWILRSQLAAVVVLLVWVLLAETTLAGALVLWDKLHGIAWLGRYLPLSAGQRLYAYDDVEDPFSQILGPQISPVAGGLTLAAVVGALLIAGYALFTRRDA